MIVSFALIAAGLVLLIASADRFIIGSSALARNLGVSPLVIGLTVVGFGTSAPEMVVSAVASFRGSPGLAVGNAIGSNIANITLILGTAALFAPLYVRSETLKREYPILLMVTILAGLLMLDGGLGRVDGVIFIVGMFLVTGWITLIGIRQGGDPIADDFAAEIPRNMNTGLAVFWVVLGMVLLPTASHILVKGAVDVASTLGVSDAVIGLTIVAIGTSLPELAAAITAARKNEHELAIGNVFGSNMFNLLGVLGIAALVHPLENPPLVLGRDYLVMLSLTVLLFFLSYGFRGREGRISRRDGIIFLLAFIAYQALVIITTWQNPITP